MIGNTLGEAPKTSLTGDLAAVWSKLEEDETARWVANLDAVLAEKLAGVGLTSNRGETHLGGFIDSFIRQRVDVKPRTQLFYEQVRDGLVEFFGSKSRFIRFHRVMPSRFGCI